MDNPITEETLKKIERPIEEARGLPNEAFTTPEFLEHENKTLFARNWVFAGRLSSVPEAGNIALAEVGGDPLIIVRDKNNEVNVFYNVCPHRGAKLVSEDQSRKPVIVCPYHAWTFNLNGSLRGRAHFNGPNKHDSGGADEKENACLTKVRFDCWEDAIFVNLDGKAPPFAEFIAPLNKQAEGFDISQFHYAATLVDEFDSNWKLTIENWSDVYHVFAVHPQLNKIMDTVQRTGMTADGNLIYCRWDYDAETLKNEKLPAAQGLKGGAAKTSFNGHLFPGLGVSLHPTMFLLWDLKPISCDKTQMTLHLYFVGGAATSPEFKEAREERMNYYLGLNAEDKGVCNLLQKGRGARGYDGGRLTAYWDGGTKHFAKLVAESTL